MSSLPVLLVHGIWDSAASIAPLARGLATRGFERVTSFDLKPSDGSATIPELAEQVRAQVDALLARHGCDQIDLVGFSMGALTSRYYLQRCGGKAHVRRFVSISGPHAGTWTAYALPLAGIRQMRPGSALLVDLDSDDNPWGSVQVHCMYTRFDLTILPARSSLLRGAHRTHELTVPIHRMMMSDPGVLDLVAEALR